MAKWVTFYWSMLGGVEDVVEHSDKETARNYFLKHCFRYFQKTPFFDKKSVKLPYSYGFAHRKYYAMTKNSYQKLWGSEKV